MWKKCLSGRLWPKYQHNTTLKSIQGIRPFQLLSPYGVQIVTYLHLKMDLRGWESFMENSFDRRSRKSSCSYFHFCICGEKALYR